MLTISVEGTDTEDAAALVAGSEAALRAVYPPEACFSLAADELAAADAVFLVARIGGAAAGCVALVPCRGYGEVKRLYVPPGRRGRGVARALMARLESEAGRRGLAVVRLETGDRLAAAVGLYESLGYRRCGPFGGYRDHPASLFMEKRLG